jgi:hypothetical protein
MPTSTVAPRRARPAFIIVSFAVLLGAAACGGVAPTAVPATASATPSPSATESRTAQPVPSAEDSSGTGGLPRDGAVDPGTYRIAASPWLVTDFTVTFPEGWDVQYGNNFHTETGTGEEIGFMPLVVDEIWTEACAGSGSGAVEVGPGVDDLVAALIAQEGPDKGEPVATSLGGVEGTRIDLRIPEGFDLHPCNVQDIGLQILYSRPADMNIVLQKGLLSTFHVLDVAGKPQVFVTQVPDAATDAERAAFQTVLDSIRIEA